MSKKECYVIWDGPNAGIYHTWEECERLVKGQPVKHRGFNSLHTAKQAFEMGYDAYNKLLREGPPKQILPDLW